MASCKGTVEDDLLELRPLCSGFCIRDFSVVTFILGFYSEIGYWRCKVMEFEVGRRMEHIFWSSCSGSILELIFWNLTFSGTWNMDIGVWTLEFGHWSLVIGDYTMEAGGVGDCKGMAGG